MTPEGWTPPEAVDPDLLAAREYMKRPDRPDEHRRIDEGAYDGHANAVAYLAGCTRGREGTTGLVEALEKQVYVMSQSHGGGARLSIGFLTTDEANDAHEAVARLTSAKRGG